MGQPSNYPVAEGLCDHPVLSRVTFSASANLAFVRFYFVVLFRRHWALAGLRHLVLPLPPSAIEIFSDR